MVNKSKMFSAVSLTLVTILLFLIANGCKKEAIHEIYYVDKETRTFCDFNKGSYWIYLLDSSTLLDTIYVHSRTQRIITNKELSLNSWEEITLGLRWSRYAESHPEHIAYFAIQGNYATVEPSTVVLEKVPLYSFANAVYTSIDELGMTDIYVQPNLTYENYFDSISIGNLKFSSVKVFSSNNMATNDQIIRSYWSKGIGRVRFEKRNGEVWNLIAYHLDQ